MSVFGIVCEFNPFHNGHKHLVDEARRMGADTVVCVMSGNSVQRGELAVFDKYVRAEAAVEAGVDLVLELPFPWCSASAEFFAGAAVRILSDFCDTLIFGSECGDIDALAAAAEVASGEDFRTEYIKRCRRGGSAAAYFGLIQERCGHLLSSNDLLGVEYMRAVTRQSAGLSAVTVKREGLGYLAGQLAPDKAPSATALRALWRTEGKVCGEVHIPDRVLDIYKKAAEAGEMTEPELIDAAVISFFRLKRPEELEGIAEADGGLVNRIISASSVASSADLLLAIVSSKRFTASKLRRVLLFCMTGVTADTLHSEPRYTTLLGMDSKGRELLSALRRSEHIEVVTKAADAPRDCPQFAATEKLDAIFTLARRSNRYSFAMMKKSAYVKI